MHFPLTKLDKFRPAIYCIECAATGDMYIGSSIRIYNRYCNHFAKVHSGSPEDMYRRLREVGLMNCEFKILSFWDGNTAEMRREECRLIYHLKPSLNKSYKKARTLPKAASEIK